MRGKLTESQLVEALSELMKVSKTVTFLDMERGEASKYRDMLSGKGYKTEISKCSLGLSSGISGFFAGYEQKYQLTVRKIKPLEGVPTHG